MLENGITHEVLAPGDTITRMTVKPNHLSPAGVSHGGAIAGMMDGVLGIAALTAGIVDRHLVSTIEFKINYFKPLHLGDKLEGHGKVIRKGKSFLVCTGSIYRAEEIVAQGQGTFNLYDAGKRPELIKLINSMMQ